MKKVRTGRLFLLAILCVVATELLFCRFADPELFEEITQPVVKMSKDMWNSTLNSAQHLLATLAAPQAEGDFEEPQVASGASVGDRGIDTDPAITELVVRDGKEILTGGSVEMSYYCQSDETWAKQLYGRDSMGDYGCGPTAMAMLVSSLSDQDITPAEMATWAVKNGHWASKSGSYLSLIASSAEAFGLQCTAIREYSVEQLYQKLTSGGVLVALVKEGHFTKSGHFIILRGMTLSGEILVADPNSRVNSLTLWDPQLILDELSNSRSNGAPLWYIAP